MRRHIIGLCLAVGLLSGCTRIGPGHVGIEIDLAGSQRGVQDFPLKTGWVLYAPWSTNVVEYPTFIQTAAWTANKNEGNPTDESITFTTKDQMVVNADISFSYHLQQDKIPNFYVQFRSDDLRAFTNGFLHNVARDLFNEVGGTYTIEQIMGDNGPFLLTVRDRVAKEIAPYGVMIDQFGFIGAPRPPKNVIDAINLKVQASQIAAQKNIEVVQAEADAKKLVAQADGQAKARIAIAEGEAQANRLITQSLTAEIIEWQRLQVTQQAIARWNGVTPTTVLGDGKGSVLVGLPK